MPEGVPKAMCRTVLSSGSCSALRGLVVSWMGLQQQHATVHAQLPALERELELAGVTLHALHSRAARSTAAHAAFLPVSVYSSVRIVQYLECGRGTRLLNMRSLTAAMNQAAHCMYMLTSYSKLQKSLCLFLTPYPREALCQSHTNIWEVMVHCVGHKHKA